MNCISPCPRLGTKGACAVQIQRVSILRDSQERGLIPRVRQGVRAGDEGDGDGNGDASDDDGKVGDGDGNIGDGNDGDGNQ